MVIHARHSGCGSHYIESGSRSPHTDKPGTRCPECGNSFVEEAAPTDDGFYAYRLTIPERLENTDLHWRLKRLAREDGAQVIVERGTGSS